MVPLGQAEFLTCGGGVLFGGWNDQNWRPFSMLISFLAILNVPSRGSGVSGIVEDRHA